MSILLNFCGSTTTNAQKKAWHLFRPSSTNNNIQFSTTQPSTGTNFPQQKDENGNVFTEYSATNVATDVNGSILFSVITHLQHTYVYDRKNTLIAHWAGGGKEIGIVPIDYGNRYHIISGNQIWDYNLGKNELHDVYTGVGGVELNGSASPSVQEFVYAIRILSSNGCTSGYRLYSIVANPPGYTGRYLRMIEYTKSNFDFYSPNDFYSPTLYDITTLAAGFNYFLCEMDLAQDGAQIAFTSNTKIIVIELGNNGWVTGSTPKSIAITQYIAGGLEFNANGTKLIYTKFDPNSTGISNNGVYVWDLSGTSVSTVGSSQDYGRSSVEMGKDGKLYVAKSDGLYTVDPTALTISSGLTGLNLYKNTDIFKYHITSSSSDFTIFNLPNQIDGQVNEKLDLNSTVFEYKFGIGTKNFTNSSHTITPQGNGKILVLSKLTIPKNSTVTLDGMDIDFAGDAVLNIEGGGKLTLKGTILKSGGCEIDMWKGVNLLKSNSSFSADNQLTLQKNSSNRASEILDAFNGITMVDQKSKLTIKESSRFSRNETDIRIFNNDISKVSIVSAIFEGQNPLINQEGAGSNYGFTDGIFRTKTHIYNFNANVKIGDNALGTPGRNIFTAAQYGVWAVSSTVQFYNTEIKETTEYGCWFNANKQANKNLTVNNCNFHNLMQGVRVELGATLTTIQNNQFSYTNGYGIQYIGNPKGVLFVGDLTNAALKNTFDHCNWAAINCFDNANFASLGNSSSGSKIYIGKNKIDNHVYASGISVGEPVGGNRNYLHMQIINNDIGTVQRVGQGIVLQNIVGGNVANALREYSKLKHNPDLMIQLNKINFTPVYTPSYRGIKAAACNKINFLDNNISSGVLVDWRNVGIENNDGSNNLVQKNTIQAGKGFMTTGNGIFSNYYCNTFNQCINGIQLNWSVLRNGVSGSGVAHNDNLIHAHKNIDNGNIYGRPNEFTNPMGWGSDIDVYTNATNCNQWDFVNYKIPKITYLSSFVGMSIVHDKNRITPCAEEPQSIDTTVISTSLLPDIGYEDLTDTVIKWKMKYAINRYHAIGQTNQFVNDNGLIAIQKIEDFISKNNYDSALFAINAFNANNEIEIDFKTVFTLWVNNRLAIDSVFVTSAEKYLDTLWSDSITFTIDSVSTQTQSYMLQYPVFDSTAIAQLTVVAQKNGINQSPAAYSARSILWATNQLQFNDPTPFFFPNITGNAGQGCGLSNLFGSVVYLQKPDSSYLPDSVATDSIGFFMFSGRQLVAFDTSILYQLKVHLNNDNWITGQSGTLSQLAYASYHQLDCSSPRANQNKNQVVDLNQVGIYPNPAFDLLTITIPDGQYFIRAMDMTGKAIHTESLSQTTTLKTSKWPRGIYIISVVNKQTGYATNQKIVLQ